MFYESDISSLKRTSYRLLVSDHLRHTNCGEGSLEKIHITSSHSLEAQQPNNPQLLSCFLEL